jgi:uncharacterized phage protein gp47/JayE
MKKEEKILQDHEIATLAQKLRPHLDRAAEHVTPHIASRLAAARQAAVAAIARPETQTASDVIANGTTLAMSGDGSRGRLTDWRFWATGLVVAALIATYVGNEWRESVDAREAADVELMILGDDLPVDALLDKGFKSFLREENN